ncbi:tachykinins isoform X1 [Aedes albopictus]|uniref:Uncharacterized protein n=1 Tax=Aedes albopictus TaxID=7160 RepID=A0ABM1ZVJ7_AEDAL
MNSTRIGVLVVFMLNIYFNHAESTSGLEISKNTRDKRDYYYSENVGNYYSNFNEPDNAITTVLPLMDTDGTSKVANDVPTDNEGDDGDDELVSHSIDDGIHYFRSDSLNNRIRPFSSPIIEERPNHDWSEDDDTDSHLDVRGKKFISFYPLRLYPKRAPSGFLGLRGKKYYYNGVKRVPSGFTVMRGKKSLYDMSSNINDNSNEYESTNDVNFDDLFQKERAFLNELYRIHRIYQENKNKPLNSAVQYAEKRAPSGFLGMRGKKAEASSTYSEKKRAPSGFLGLRGKRESIDDYMEGIKRSPLTSYFGTRGKKEPLMFGNDEFYNHLDAIDWPNNEQRLQINRTPPKRVPNGFLGVRGKKWTDALYDE